MSQNNRDLILTFNLKVILEMKITKNKEKMRILVPK